MILRLWVLPLMIITILWMLSGITHAIGRIINIIKEWIQGM